jgi:Family of unknown function (DUF6768)
MANAKSEMGLLHEACAVFKGPHGGWAWLALLFALAFLVLFVYAAWKFCGLTDSASPIYWLAVAGVSVLALAMIKLWFWMMMIRNSIVRELKKP